MPSTVRCVADVSPGRGGQVGPSSLIGITFWDETLRVFSWCADSLTQLNIVAGPPDWSPYDMLYLPDSHALLVTSYKKHPDEHETTRVELFTASDTLTFQHSRTLAAHAAGWDIEPGWTVRKSAGELHVVVFDRNSRELKLFDLR